MLLLEITIIISGFVAFMQTISAYKYTVLIMVFIRLAIIISSAFSSFMGNLFKTFLITDLSKKSDISK